MLLCSIIIPIYRVEEYLHQCIDSVLSQTFQGYEIILVDDGSPDCCPKICDDYAERDSRIKVIHQPNAGVACARNNGMNHASGEYLLFLDSDDYLSDKSILERISILLVDSPDVVLLGFNKYFESDGTYSSDNIPVITNLCSTSEMLELELRNGTYGGAAWTKLVKTSLLKSNNIIFRLGMVSFEDSDWFLNVLMCAKTYAACNQAVVTYRQRDNSASHSQKIQSLEDAVWLLETWSMKIESLIQEKNIVKSLMQVLAYYYANDMILFSIYPSTVSTIYKKRLKAQSHLLDYAVSPRAICIRNFYKIVGFDITILLLKILAKVK